MGATRVAALALLLCAVVRGQSCGSIDFSGSLSPLESPPLSFTGDFTVECWAKLTTVGDMYIPFMLVDLDTNSLVTYVIVGDGTICVSTGCPSFSTIAGQWYHYAMTRAGSDVSIFIDGARVIDYAVSGLIGTPTTVLRIGGYGPGSYTWAGAIADFRVVTGAALYT